MGSYNLTQERNYSYLRATSKPLELNIVSGLIYIFQIEHFISMSLLSFAFVNSRWVDATAAR
jgi:hypothetical protein